MVPKVAVGAAATLTSVVLYELISRSVGTVSGGATAAGASAGDGASAGAGAVWDVAWDDPGALPADSEEALELRRAGDPQVERRHIIFVRHAQPASGQAAEGEGAGKKAKKKEFLALSPEGRKQAELTGQRLKMLFEDVDAVYYSAAPESKATAQILHRCLSGGDPKSATRLVESGLFAEAVPGLPSPAPEALKEVPAAELEADAARAEAAFRALVWSPKLTSKEQVGLTSVEVVVGHGNLIRYLACRALQLPPSAWSRMAASHCTLTWIDIGCDGSVAMREFGSSGHLPPDLVTYY